MSYLRTGDRLHKRPLSGLQRLTRASIEHPYTIIAFVVAMVSLSIYCTSQVIPRRFAPYVQSPMVAVVTMMPGLPASEVETYISKPMEDQLDNIRDLHYIRSTSENGISIVTLEFNYGVDIHAAEQRIQNQLNVAQSFLPNTNANLKPSFILPVDPLNLPVVSLALTGDPDKGWTPEALRNFADNDVERALKTLPQVESAVVFGGYTRQMQVLVDRNKLANYHLSILDVRNAIDNYNQSRPGGVITSESEEAIVEVGKSLTSAESIENIPVMSTNSTQSEGNSTPFQTLPRVVTIGDVAKVIDSHWERTSAYNFLDHPAGKSGLIIPAIEVSVVQDPAASSYSLMPKVNAILKQLEQEHPGIHFQAAYDNAHFVSVLFNNVWEELGTAILLTGIAVFFFLGEWRSTLIAIITLPTSLAIAVLMLIPFHLSFNSGTLIGLLLCIGRIVDDSIIDIHSVERHLRMGKTPKQATIDGISEVRLAVIASTLMLVIALLPLLFCGGITQQMFVELILPFIFGLLASMLVSFTLTALLCASLLRTDADREKERSHRILRWLYLLTDPFQRFLLWLESRYQKLLRGMLKERFWNFARIGVTIIIGFTFYNFIGSEMMPLADTGQAFGSLEMKPGTSFQQTETAVHQLEQIMLQDPELKRASIEIGSENMFQTWNPDLTGYQMPQNDGASMLLTFNDKSQRSSNIWQLMDAIQHKAMMTIPGLRRLQIKEMGSDVMAEADAPVYINVYGKSLHVLNLLGKQVLQIAKHTYGLVQPSTSWTLGVPEYHVHVDAARAEMLGLTPAAVAEQAYYALNGGLTNEFLQLPNQREDTILVRYADHDRDTPQNLANLQITTPDGRTIPLKSVASFTMERAPTAIEHDGLRRVIGISGYYRKWGPPSMNVSMDVMMKAMDQLNFPPGYGIEMRGDMTQMMDSFRRLLDGLVVSFVLMYLVLAAQFRGFLQPIQMLASLPLELSGVFFALWLAHQAFSTVSILGVIVLTGMDITTAILMIDSIMRSRDRGLPRDEAVVEAAPVRLRPILMTSLITIIVMTPVALFPKTGLDAYQPLATTILGGLIVGTTLSLFDIPILHTAVDDVVVWLNRHILRREYVWRVPEEETE